MLRLGFICSSGGSPVFSAFELLRRRKMALEDNFYMVTDRICGAMEKAITYNIPYKVITYENSLQFSENAKETLSCYDGVILLYSRHIGKNLYCEIPVLNIHPGILPDFPGLNAVKKAFDCHAENIGATLHLVTEEFDAGPIIAKKIDPVSYDKGLDYYCKISFLQKVYLILLAFIALDENILTIDLKKQEITFKDCMMEGTIRKQKLPDANLHSDFLCFCEKELSTL